jgi:hypothetical protein
MASADVIFITKGTPAQYDGYLFPPDVADATRKKLLTLNDLNSMNKSYQHSIDLYKQNENIYQKQLDLLTTQNNKLVNVEQQSLSMSSYEKLAYFGLGVLATGLAVYAAEKTLINK